MFYFMFERERETVCYQGGTESGGGKILKQAPGSELSAQSPMCGSNSHIVRSLPELEIAHLTD